MEPVPTHTPTHTNTLNDACLRGDVAAVTALFAKSSDYKLANEYACEHGGAVAVELARLVLNYLKSLGNAARGYSRRYWVDFNSHGLIGLCRRGNLAEIKHSLSRRIDNDRLIMYSDCLYVAAYRGHVDVVELLVADTRCTREHIDHGISGALAGSFAGVHHDHIAVIAALRASAT